MSANNTQDPSRNTTVRSILGGDQPLLTTNNKVELDEASVFRSALAIGGVTFFFALLFVLAKWQLNKSGE